MRPSAQQKLSLAATLIIAACAVLGAAVTIGHLVAPQIVKQQAPPIDTQFGWAGPEVAKAAYEEIKNEIPKFAIVGGEDDPGRRVVLWDGAKRANKGEHIKTLHQPIGCCVGAGACQACQYLFANQADADWGTTELRLLFPPYHYACGRMAPDCGKGSIRGPDGSVGSWQAKALTIYGVLPMDTPGLPPYDAANARQWAVRMPDQKWIDLGKQHCIGAFAPAKTADDVRQAIQNLYPVTIASNWGGMGSANDGYQAPVTEIAGVKLRLNKRRGTWPHQMCVIGYQMLGGRKLFYVLNSWGESMHGTPPDDAPPGGFWIEEADMEYIVRQGDSWVLSKGTGFPAQRLDFHIFQRGEKEERHHVSPRQIARPRGHLRRVPVYARSLAG